MIWPLTKRLASDGKTDMFNTWEATEPIQQLPALMVRASDFRRVHDELLDHKKVLQYFVDTFGGPEKWKAAGYMQVHRGEALKMAKALGITPHASPTEKCEKCGTALSHIEPFYGLQCANEKCQD